MLDLDPDLAFPERAHAARITLRHLLSHASGLYDTMSVESDPRAAAAPVGRRRARPRLSLLERCLTTSRTRRPHARRAWTAFTLLRERVLSPIGMTATHLDLEARAAAAFLFDHPAGYAVSLHAMLDAALAREMRPPAYSGRT